jgi:hypothetical protein
MTTSNDVASVIRLDERIEVVRQVIEHASSPYSGAAGEDLVADRIGELYTLLVQLLIERKATTVAAE